MYGIGDIETLTLNGEEIAKIIADLLPHGSGIDYDWNIRETTLGTYRCCNAYHAMDEGSYCCVNNFTAIVEVLDNGKLNLKRLMFHDYNNHAHNFGLREYLESDLAYSLSQGRAPSKANFRR